jgi:hypothetical protein
MYSKAAFSMILALILALGAGSPAMAQRGSGNSASGGNGNADGRGGQSASGGNQGANGSNQGASGVGQGNPGHGNSSGVGAGNKPGNAAAPSSKADALDVEASLREVRAGNAVTLERILAIARRGMSSRIIDVRLMRWNESLIYEIKGLSSAGRIENMYLYAKSGRPVTN